MKMKKIILIAAFTGSFYAVEAQNNGSTNGTGTRGSSATNTISPSQNNSGGNDYKKSNGTGKKDSTGYGGSNGQNYNNSQNGGKRKPKTDTLRNSSNPK